MKSEKNESLRDSVDAKELLDALLERSSAAVLIVDGDRNYIECSAEACRLLSFSREELLEMKIEDITPDEQKSDVQEAFAAFLQSGNMAGDYIVQSKEGEDLLLHYSATANILPGVHISYMTPSESKDEELDQDVLAREELSSREREVLTLLALGETNQTIAKKLHLSPETVRNYTRSARLKLGAKSRSHAIALAVAAKELDLEMLLPEDE